MDVWKPCSGRSTRRKIGWLIESKVLLGLGERKGPHSKMLSTTPGRANSCRIIQECGICYPYAYYLLDAAEVVAVVQLPRLLPPILSP